MIKFVKGVLLFLFGLTLVGCGGGDENFDSLLGWDVEKKAFDEFVISQAKGLDVPGLSIGVINDGELVHRLNYGFADLSEQQPVDDQTIFEGASISKPVFAYFVMHFVEEGKLDLDRPLYQYLVHKDLQNQDWARKITARLILSHQSGLPNWRENEPNQALHFIFEPGTDYGYSGEAYQYLAEVLREIEKTDWPGLERLFQQKVAQPLGMEHTVFIQNAYTRSNKATPYDENSERVNWEENYWFLKNDSIFVAPASIHSEPGDFSKWMIALMKEEGLSETSYADLLARQVEIPDSPVEAFYTLGFVNLAVPGFDIFMHTGNNEGFTSYFLLDKKEKWGYVLFTNSEYGEDLGLILLLYLFAGPKIKIAFALMGILSLGILVGLVYGIYRLIKFAMA
ncbi:serine hydrolase domain-containing protein [Algoriphagus namhaensis]